MAVKQHGPEFDLLLQCCQSHIGTLSDDLEISNPQFDESRFTTLVKNHRVSSFVVQQLEQLPISQNAKEQIKLLNKESRQRALGQCKGLVDIQGILKQIDVSFIVLKGVLLSQQLYSDVAFRSSRDIDILIRPENLLTTYKHLLSNGFTQLEPKLKLTAKNIDVYLRLTNQISFGNAQGQMLEVHWTLFNGKNAFPYSNDEVWELTEKVGFMGREFLVLGNSLRYQFLYVHGARHHYSNLFWLLDVVSLSQQMGSELLGKQLNMAHERDLDRPLKLSLELSKQLLHLTAPCSYTLDQKTPKQFAFVQHLIEPGTPRTGTVSDNWRFLIYRLGLRRKWGYKADHFKLFSLKDYGSLPLPSYLHWAYFFLRPFILVARYTTKK